MARPRRGQRSEKDSRPVATDDFIYEQTEEDSVTVSSDTPEEAVRKLRVRNDKDPDSSVPEDENTYPDENRPVPNKRKVYSSGVILDDNLEPVGKVRYRSHPVLRRIILVIITLVLLVTAGAYILHRIVPGTAVLGAPENAVSAVQPENAAEPSDCIVSAVLTDSSKLSSANAPSPTVFTAGAVIFFSSRQFSKA